MLNWQLADAKNRFSDLFTKAMTIGPQRVKRRNEAIIVISEYEYLRLLGEKKDFISFLLTGPDLTGLDIERQRDSFRPVDL